MGPMTTHPGARFKPQWAYKTPAGCRDEEYIIPFTFNVPGDGSIVRGLPLSLDDDVPYLLRAIIFPQIGLNPTIYTPGFARIKDTIGNPLTDDLTLTLGGWGESGWDEAPITGIGSAAFGFPVEPELDCEPGGILTFDFQLSTNAAVALLAHVGIAETITFAAGVFGSAGNAWTIQTINPGAANVPLSVAVVAGNQVQVTLATDGGAAIISTFAQVAAAIASTAGAGYAFVSGPNPAEVITAFGPTPLNGGLQSSTLTIQGALIGVKRYKDC